MVMSQWLLSITGVVLIGVLVELLLTDSPMSKFVRSIYAFFILFVIVQPLPQFLNSASEMVGGEVSLPINTELLATINAQSAAALERRVVSELERAGYTDVIIVIECDKTASAFKAARVFVNAYGAVITKPNSNIDMKKEITDIVRAVTVVDESKIFYAG